MIRVTFLLLSALLAFASCRQDSATAEGQATGNTAVSASAKTANETAMNVRGFNFLTACDSLVVSTLVLSGPNGEGDFAYVKGECATGSKTYELLLVPRTGATPAGEFGDAAQVLAKAAKNGYKDYICYAFELPKLFKEDATGTVHVVDLFPINAVIKRLDNSEWIRLGQDRANELSDYNTLRWNILHDNMPQYD